MSQHTLTRQDHTEIINPQPNRWLKIVESQVEGLKFGSVAITVHESRVVQIETNVKIRFDKAQP